MNELEAKTQALEIAIKALKYCQIEPEFLRPENNRQNAVAMNALSEIEAILALRSTVKEEKDR